MGANLTSAAGEPLVFTSNATGSFVTSGSGGSAVRITKTDLLVDNGVVHVIDGVLADLAANPAAASSA